MSRVVSRPWNRLKSATASIAPKETKLTKSVQPRQAATCAKCPRLNGCGSFWFGGIHKGWYYWLTPGSPAIPAMPARVVQDVQAEVSRTIINEVRSREQEPRYSVRLRTAGCCGRDWNPITQGDKPPARDCLKGKTLGSLTITSPSDTA